MAEKNYITLLKKLKELRNSCQKLQGYSPAQKFIQINSLNSKIETIENLNKDIISIENQLDFKRKMRIKMIKGLSEKHGMNGIIRLSRQAVNFVDAFGKEYSAEQKILRNLVGKMQPKGGNNGFSSLIPQSYDAITEAAEEFYHILKDLPEYAPADQNISISGYHNKVNEIKELSANIALLYNELKPLIRRRYDEYHSKEYGVRRVFTEVKKYVRGNWGIISKEYNTIKDMKV